MSKNYDNWERLVGAVLLREQLRQIALDHSRTPSSISYESSDYGGSSRLRFLPQYYQRTTTRSVPGKRIFLPVEARELVILNGDFPDGQLQYSTYSDSRITEVVKVNSASSLDIRGKIKTRMLTPNTIYGAYIVFISADNFKGFESAKAIIRFVNDETVDIEAVDEREGEIFAMKRDDGEMEVEIGKFYVDEGGDDKEVEVRLLETTRCRRTRLIVEGIEFQPLYITR